MSTFEPLSIDFDNTMSPVYYVTDVWSVIMNNSPNETDTKMEEVLRDFVLNTNVLKSAFQISGEE